LSRAVFVMMAWAMSCVLIDTLCPEAASIMFWTAGACWVGGGSAYFAYLGKLRREIDDLQRIHCYTNGKPI
jgi:hypothetical protein